MPFFGTTPFAAPGLGMIAAAIMLGFGLWWLSIRSAQARRRNEGYGDGPDETVDAATQDLTVRELATTAREFDPAEIARGRNTDAQPSFATAVLPLVTVVAVNLLMSLIVLPRIDAGFLSEPRWGATSLGAVGGIWSVAVALFAAIVLLIALNLNRLPGIPGTIDAGANASALPILSVASLVGFGAVVAAMPAFEAVSDWLLGLGGGPLVSLAMTVNVLAGLTGSASGGMTIALDALGPTFMAMAAKASINPELLHRVAVIGSGTLDSLPHNGAVVTMLALCGCTHRTSYLDIVMVAVVGAILALVAVIVLGTAFGSF
jgi:H+/gluconate symporter-like permease